MLLDNKTKTEDSEYCKVFDYLRSYIESGKVEKQQNPENKKVLIFTVYKDTAKYIFDELNKRGLANIAFVSGAYSETNDGFSGAKFEPPAGANLTEGIRNAAFTVFDCYCSNAK